MKGRWIDYSQAELDWVRDSCTLPISELHCQFCAVFGREDVSANNLAALRKRNGWKTGRSGQFPKGSVPANKGKIQSEFMSQEAIERTKQSRFKKGSIPANTKPLYHERINKDGYIEIKVPEPNPHTSAATRFRHKHVWLWEQHYGNVAKGHVVIFKDGNKENCEISNLQCVPRGVLPMMNKHLRAQDYPEQLKPTVIAMAQVAHAAHARSKP